ncbi:MAG: hypothetical protein ACTHJS_04130 [Xanthobacteraceae bacterium]
MNEIRREARQPIEMTVSPAVFDSDILTVNVTGFLQSCAERGLKERARIAPSNVEKSDHRFGRLLRARRQRRKCSSAQNSNEFAPSHAPPPDSRRAHLNMMVIMKSVT